MRARRRFAVLVAAVLLPAALAAGEKKPKPIIEISTEDVPAVSTLAQPAAFDISPDGKRVAVLFRAPEANRNWNRQTYWVGVWEILSRKRIVASQLDDEVTGLGKPPLPGRCYLRFAAEGRKLVVSTSYSIRVLDADTSQQSFLAAPAQIDSRFGPLIHQIAISNDG